ncbi:response regulator [Calothrix sp. 336/3]|uniref:response regulator n=1 Tax=Calothrix sp. 336/3 TaxID=1337936 RepID=UPI0004E31A1F|nr:response regulator transcription factor [Calothrix sp. 336/3]AKG23326.1 LuxR family transcriptional regulator [Calothrix sp. 336/3]
MIRILLVDDQNLIRRGMKALLKSDGELAIVGEAENGKEAISLVESLRPDVILMDIRMPIMDGVAATQEISQRFPEAKVLVLTTFDDEEYVTQAMRNGASGYLLKDTPFEELTQAIRLVDKGYTQLGPGIANKITSKIFTSVPSPDVSVDLTPREKEILQMIAQGASNREIAQALFISEKTVRNHVTNILSRLGLRDRTQAAIYFHSHLEHLVSENHREVD